MSWSADIACITGAMALDIRDIVMVAHLAYGWYAYSGDIMMSITITLWRDERPFRHIEVDMSSIVGWLALAGGAGAAYLTRRFWGDTLERLTRGASGPNRPASSAVAAVARGLIPESGAAQGTPQWDALMGGREISPGRWPRWKPGDGTTCGVVVAGIMTAAGAPQAYLSGGLASVGTAAQRRGELIQPIMPEDLKPGDIYKLAGPDHVGIIISNDGRGTLVTADGGAHDGQGRQMARRWTRTYEPGVPIIHNKVTNDARALQWAARWNGKP